MVKFAFQKPFGLLLQAMLLPHILFATIYRSYQETWKKVICPSTEAVTIFWREMAAGGNPNLTTELTNRKNYKSGCIPICLHGDGVPVSGIGKGWVHTVTSFSWYSLLTTSAPAADSLFFICALYDKLRRQGKDLDATGHHFLCILKWSFEALFEGKWPSRDYLGQPFPSASTSGRRAGQALAGGYFATLWAVVGDLDYLASVRHGRTSDRLRLGCLPCSHPPLGELCLQMQNRLALCFQWLQLRYACWATTSCALSIWEPTRLYMHPSFISWCST